MTSRRQTVLSSDDGNSLRVAKTPSAAPPLPASKLPPAIRFPLLTIISLATSAFLYFFVGEYSQYELATTSRHVSKEWETFAVVSSALWRVLELGIGWFGGYDDFDLAALTIVSHFPYLYLVSTFYSISVSTSFLALTVDVLSIALPIRLLRPRSPTHSSSPTVSALVPNRSIIHDIQVVAATSALGSAIYSVTFFLVLRIGLTTFLVSNFDNIPSVLARDASTIVNLLPILLPIGWATREFILDPSLGVESLPNTGDARTAAFNPSTASLAETVAYNFWVHYSKRTRVVIGRTLLLAGWVLANTTVQVYARVRGAEVWGAFGWGAVFAVPSLLVGLAFGIVADV